MNTRAALKSALRTVFKPQLIALAALVLGISSFSPPSIEQASAQGWGGSSRFNAPSSGRGGMYNNRKAYRHDGYHRRTPGSRRPGSHSSGNYPRTESHYPRRPHYPRPRPGTGTADTRHPDSHYPRHPRYPRPRPGTTVDTRYPDTRHPEKRNPRYPRHPRYPRPTIVVPSETFVAIPGGAGAPPPTVLPPSAGGGRQPPATAPAQTGRRPGTGVPPANERRYVPNEVIVELAAGASNQQIDAMLRRHRLTRLQSFNLQLTGTSIQRLRINDRRSVPQVVRALETDSFVMAAQPSYIARLGEAGLPAGVRPYAPDTMRLQEAHQLATGNRILVAVIDGGVDTRHPELAGMVHSSFDAIGNGDRVHAHGTGIVGAIAARASVRGTAPGAHILAARAFGTHRTSMDGTTPNILLSIDWAVQRGARIINMSFAGARDPQVERLLAGARQRGVILVAAVGNAGPTSDPLYPAALPGVIAVTATDEQNRIFRAANRGNHIAIAAPGVDLWLPTLDRGYRMTSGTSFAAAEVSGLIALMLERNPTLTPDQVRHALITTARDLGARGADPEFGAGLIDAYQAVLIVSPTAPAAQTTGGSAR